MPISYHKENKDNKDLDEIRLKRAQEQEERRRKSQIEMDILSKKRFVLSTNSTLDVKKTLLQQKQSSLKVALSEVQSIDQKIKKLESETSSLRTEYDQKIKKLGSDTSSLRREYDQRNSFAQSVQREVNSLESALSQLTNDKSRLDGEIRRLEQEKR